MQLRASILKASKTIKAIILISKYTNKIFPINTTISKTIFNLNISTKFILELKYSWNTFMGAEKTMNEYKKIRIDKFLSSTNK